MRVGKKFEIAKITGYDRSIISKFLKRYATRKSIENDPRSGRPKKMSVQSERILKRLVLRDRRQNLGDLTEEFNCSVPRPVSKRSVQRKLHLLSYTRHKVVTTLTISAVNRKRRIDCCKNHKNWTVDIIFSGKI